jgi:hypothetical protein
MIEVTFNVITTIQDFIQIHQSVQKLLRGFFTHTPQKFKRRPFWNGWSYEIKKMWHRGHLQCHHLPTKFHENPPIGSEVISGGTHRQTGWWFDKPTLIFLKVGWKWSDIVVVAHILSLLLLRRKELLHFGLHIHLQGQYSVQFPFWHCVKLALCCNLNFTEIYINFEKYVIH